MHSHTNFAYKLKRHFLLLLLLCFCVRDSSVFREEEVAWHIGTMLPEGVLVKVANTTSSATSIQ